MAHKIIIASGKGGVGKSSSTICLARALTARGKRVLVMDFDIGLRSADLLLGVSDQVVFDWGDVLTRHCDPQRAFLEPEPNLLFISAPAHFQQSFSAESVQTMVEILNSSFHYILLDAPAGMQNGFQLAAAAADSALIVSTPDEVCVRSANKAARALTELGVAHHRLLLNRLRKRSVFQGKQLNIDQTIDATAVQLLGVIPEDAFVTDNLAHGLPLPKNSPAGQAYARIAARLLGENVPLVI